MYQWYVGEGCDLENKRMDVDMLSHKIWQECKLGIMGNMRFWQKA